MSLRPERHTPFAGPALAFAALLLTAPPVLLAQASEEELSVTARAFAAAWGEGRTPELADGMAAGGIRLHLPDASHPVLPVRIQRQADWRLAPEFAVHRDIGTAGATGQLQQAVR